MLRHVAPNIPKHFQRLSLTLGDSMQHECDMRGRKAGVQESDIARTGGQAHHVQGLRPRWPRSAQAQGDCREAELPRASQNYFELTDFYEHTHYVSAPTRRANGRVRALL